MGVILIEEEKYFFGVHTVCVYCPLEGQCVCLPGKGASESLRELANKDMYNYTTFSPNISLKVSGDE